MVNDVQFYLYTILAVIVLSLAVGFFAKRYFIIPILSFAAMGIAAFVLPNFYNNLSWEPLLGYAAFLGVLSFAISMSVWVVNRNRKRAKETRAPHETIKEAEDKREI